MGVGCLLVLRRRRRELQMVGDEINLRARDQALNARSLSPGSPADPGRGCQCALTQPCSSTLSGSRSPRLFSVYSPGCPEKQRGTATREGKAGPAEMCRAERGMNGTGGAPRGDGYRGEGGQGSVAEGLFPGKPTRGRVRKGAAGKAGTGSRPGFRGGRRGRFS